MSTSATRVCGVGVNGGNTAQIAKKLLYAHALVVCIGLCVGILEVIKRWGANAAFADVPGQRGQGGMMSGGVGIVLTIGFPIVLPMFFSVARESSDLRQQHELVAGLVRLRRLLYLL